MACVIALAVVYIPIAVCFRAPKLFVRQDVSEDLEAKLAWQASER